MDLETQKQLLWHKLFFLKTVFCVKDTSCSAEGMHSSRILAWGGVLLWSAVDTTSAGNASPGLFKWFGVSLSRRELNNKTIPGVEGVDFTWPKLYILMLCT